MVIFPVYLVAGFVHLLAKNYNFNVNATKNPHLDMIRMKRDAYGTVETPFAPNFKMDDFIKKKPKEIDEITNVIDIFKGKGKRWKRDTYLIPNNQPYTSAPYNGYNHNGYNHYNETNNGYNHNDVANNGYNDNAKNLSSTIKTKPNIFVRTFNAIASSFGSAKTTPRPHLSQYNSVQNYPYLNNNQNGGFTNQNGVYHSNVNTNQNNYERIYQTAEYAKSYGTNNAFNNNNVNNRYNDRIAPSGGNVYNNVPVPYNNNNNNYPNYANNAVSNNMQRNQIYTTPIYENSNKPVLYINNQINGIPNNSNVNKQTYSPFSSNNSVETVSSTAKSFLIKKFKKKRVKIETTTILDKGCILCSTFSCPDNQVRVGFTCREVSDSGESDDYILEY